MLALLLLTSATIGFLVFYIGYTKMRRSLLNDLAFERRDLRSNGQ